MGVVALIPLIEFYSQLDPLKLKLKRAKKTINFHSMCTKQS